MVYNVAMHSRFAALCVSLVVATAACGENQAERRASATAQRVAALQADPELGDPLGRELFSLVQEQAPGWVKQDKLFRGTLAERARQSYLAILPYGPCYRFIGVGGPGVSDLDLALHDANGVEVQRDVTDDPNPVIGTTASVCPLEASSFRLEVGMRRGAGDFVVGVFHDVLE